MTIPAADCNRSGVSQESMTRKVAMAANTNAYATNDMNQKLKI